MKQTKGQKTRERLLIAATERFSESGLAGARVHDIVRAAGVSQAAFYMHFKTKEGLYHHLLEGFLEGLKAIVTGSEPPKDPMEIPSHLTDVLVDAFQYLAKSPELTRLAFKADEAAEARLTLAAAIHKNLTELANAGLTQNVDEELVAEAIVGIIERLTVRFLLTGERTPESLAQGVFGLIFSALHRAQV